MMSTAASSHFLSWNVSSGVNSQRGLLLIKTHTGSWVFVFIALCARKVLVFHISKRFGVPFSFLQTTYLTGIWMYAVNITHIIPRNSKQTRLICCMQFANNPQDHSHSQRNVYSAHMNSTFKLKLASAVSLTLQVRHSSSNTVADWSNAAGPSLKTTAGRWAGVS